MIRLLRTEKQHWPGPGTTGGKLPEGPFPHRHTLQLPGPGQGGSPAASCFPQRRCQGCHSQVKRSNGTAGAVTGAQTAQVLLTKERSPGLGAFACHEL